MIAQPILRDLQRKAQWRVVFDTLALGAPAVLVLAALLWRLSGAGGSAAIALTAMAVVAGAAVWRARRLDQRWLVARLDAGVPRFEDSTVLLFRDRSAFTGLAALQRDRLEARISEAVQVDLRPGWTLRPILIGWGLAVIIAVAVLLWPAGERTTGQATATTSAPSTAAAPAITGGRLRITPPAYTGLPAREQTALDARAPEGSRVEWIIGFAPQPASATLAFPENTPTALVRDGSGWTGSRIITQPMLYRIEADGMVRQRLHRLEAVADAPPTVQLIEPDRQLVLVTPGQTSWSPVFEASDDYGVIASATLRITVTKGDGENITFEQRSIPVTGRGDPKRLRFAVTLDMAREGMAPGSDLIVQLIVSDNRSPERHQVEGPSVILRWPADLAMADGLDGMALNIVPAYFRSQRQIIIDAEALIAERAHIEPQTFMNRSNTLGADQADLRLRYGQFMGEEAEGGGSGGGIALPTNDAPARPALPTNDDPAPAAPDHHDDHDDHDHGAEEPGGPVGSGDDVLNQFGHAHDTGDAATLFDPGTRSTLALALDAMWSSERALRQGRPQEALPFAYQALELLKQAQQASRIFLARTGPDLPPIDLSRRLSGEREDIVAEDPDRPERTRADAVPAEAWRALQEGPGPSAPLALGALDRWVRDNRGRLSDALALSAAIDTVRNEPNCLSCRRTLRGLLWGALERPAPTVQRRRAPNARGQRYLDALR
ncbi:MAG: DUF4175 domain-containing protein [Alphaproteobacteria bacterium]|nr:DUF4175 domain-containing protein [Alphaproteobacteria bacterium]MBU2378934.1 DUF4175 domain-containing protein [Alphaproteobacteria bacterium]